MVILHLKALDWLINKAESLIRRLRPWSKFLIGKKCAWSLDHSHLRLLIAWFSRVNGQTAATSTWSIDFSSSGGHLDWPSKRALIAWFKFDPSCKRFYTGHISDYLHSNIVWTPDPSGCMCKGLGNNFAWKCVARMPRFLNSSNFLSGLLQDWSGTTPIFKISMFYHMFATWMLVGWCDIVCHVNTEAAFQCSRHFRIEGFGSRLQATHDYHLLLLTSKLPKY